MCKSQRALTNSFQFTDHGSRESWVTKWTWIVTTEIAQQWGGGPWRYDCCDAITAGWRTSQEQHRDGGHRRRRRSGSMEQQAAVLPEYHWVFSWTGKYMEVPLPVSAEWRRWVTKTTQKSESGSFLCDFACPCCIACSFLVRKSVLFIQIQYFFLQRVIILCDNYRLTQRVGSCIVLKQLT